MQRELTPRLVWTLALEDGKARTLVYDTDRDAPRGFALLISASARIYYLIATIRGKKRQAWVRIGDAKTITLDQARAAAKLRAGEIAFGRDPNAEARAAREAEVAERLKRDAAAAEWTVARMVEAYLATRRIAIDTRYEYQRQLDRDMVGTKLGEMLARDVVKDDVRRFINPIARRSPAMAESILRLLRSAFRWAIDEEVIVETGDGERVARARVERDPTRRIEDSIQVNIRVRGKKRKRHLSDAELAMYWPALEKLGDSRRGVMQRAFARLILTCGTRSTETHLAQWPDVVLDGLTPTWHIPAAHRKGRPEQREPLDVPLSRLAVEQFRAVKALPVDPRHRSRRRVWYFSQNNAASEIRAVICTDPAHREKDKDVKLAASHRGAVTEGAWCLGDVTVHDLRRTCSSGLKRLGCPPHVISHVLGHVREEGATQTDAVYSHGARETEVRHWLRRWADHIEWIVSGKRPADVVPISGRG